MQSKKVLIKLIRHDLSYGFRQSAQKYILVFLFFLYASILFFSSLQTLKSSDMVEGSGSVTDCWIYIFKGMGIYIPSRETPFQIPVYWLLIQALLAFLILNYPTGDLYGHGVQILLRAKSKCFWWISKSVWNFLTVLAFYFAAFLAVCAVSLIFGDVSFAPDPAVNREVNQINLEGLQALPLYFAVFLLPIFTSWAVSMVQMALSFVLSPIISYFILICYMILSAYYCSPLCIGNFSMLFRNEQIEPAGTGNLTAVLIDIAVCFIAFFAGMLYFQRADILKKR